MAPATMRTGQLRQASSADPLHVTGALRRRAESGDMFPLPSSQPALGPRRRPWDRRTTVSSTCQLSAVPIAGSVTPSTIAKRAKKRR
jgi:hypothetical protein